MKKILAFVITIVMIASMVSVISFAEEAEEIEIAPKYGQIENWPAGDDGKTWFIVGFKSSDNKAITDKLKAGEATLRVKITDDEGNTYCIPEYFFDTPAREFYSDSSFMRIAVCEYGIPVKSGANYTVYMDVVVDGKIAYFGESEPGAFSGSENEAFKNNGPIIPAEVPHSYTETLPDAGNVTPKPFEKELAVAPLFGKVENWSGKTWFIVEPTSSNNAKLFGNLSNGTWTLDVIIKDETTGEARIIKGYAFDDKGREMYGTWFFRFAVCEYGIVPVNGHKYTVRLNVYRGQKLIFSGTSETGAFYSLNDAFVTNGPIIPETPSHSSEVYNPN